MPVRKKLNDLLEALRYAIFAGPKVPPPDSDNPLSSVMEQVSMWVSDVMHLLNGLVTPSGTEHDSPEWQRISKALPPELVDLGRDWQLIVPAIVQPVRVTLPARVLAAGLAIEDLPGTGVNVFGHEATNVAALSMRATRPQLFMRNGLLGTTSPLDLLKAHYFPLWASQVLKEHAAEMAAAAAAAAGDVGAPVSSSSLTSDTRPRLQFGIMQDGCKKPRHVFDEQPASALVLQKNFPAAVEDDRNAAERNAILVAELLDEELDTVIDSDAWANARNVRHHADGAGADAEMAEPAIAARAGSGGGAELLELLTPEEKKSVLRQRLQPIVSGVVYHTLGTSLRLNKEMRDKLDAGAKEADNDMLRSDNILEHCKRDWLLQRLVGMDARWLLRLLTPVAKVWLQQPHACVVLSMHG